MQHCLQLLRLKNQTKQPRELLLANVPLTTNGSVRLRNTPRFPRAGFFSRLPHYKLSSFAFSNSVNCVRTAIWGMSVHQFIYAFVMNQAGTRTHRVVSIGASAFAESELNSSLPRGSLQ